MAAMTARWKSRRHWSGRSRIRRIATGGPMRAPMPIPARCRPISTGNTVWSSNSGATRPMAFSLFEFSSLSDRRALHRRGQAILAEQHGAGLQRAVFLLLRRHEHDDAGLDVGLVGSRHQGHDRHVGGHVDLLLAALVRD